MFLCSLFSSDNSKLEQKYKCYLFQSAFFLVLFKIYIQSKYLTFFSVFLYSLGPQKLVLVVRFHFPPFLIDSRYPCSLAFVFLVSEASYYPVLLIALGKVTQLSKLKPYSEDYITAGRKAWPKWYNVMKSDKMHTLQFHDFQYIKSIPSYLDESHEKSGKF